MLDPEDKTNGATEVEPDEDGQSASGNVLCPVVGIGASAGGLEAFTQMLKRLPTSAGLGFVLVQHLDPHHVSMLPELLASHTAMPVKQAGQGTTVEPNHIYVIPPNTQMAIRNGVLELTPRTFDRSRYLPIDFFLSSLAEDLKDRAIGVILSGSASDGTSGLEAIKAAGGITFAQDESATFNGMPRSAVAAGVVDFVSSPEAIAQEIASIAGHWGAKAESTVEDGPTLQKILNLLQSRTGVAFTHYKKPTIFRRLARRMALNHVGILEEYLALLEQRAKEVDELFDDLLITVTEFFREPAVFEAIAQIVFPSVLKDRGPEEAIRIWVPGCSSGKEVYSLVILLLEYLESTNQSFPIQIFGTDVSEHSIEVARAAKYPENICNSVSASRLKNYFIKLEHGYQVKRSVRELCVFSRQDVTKDPPLSKMDLISCRNLLIYLGPLLQRRVIAIFSYALQPNGCLVLGNSESLGALSDHFIALDQKHKIFTRNLQLARPSFDLPIGMANRPVTASAMRLDDATLLDRSADRLLLHGYAPSGFLVNSDDRVMKFRGEVGPYLAPPAGDPELDLFKLVHEDIAIPLRSALEEAKSSDRMVRREHVQVRRGEEFREISILVRPMSDGSLERHFLVLFEEAAHRARGEQSSEPEGRADQHRPQEYQNLVLELASTRTYMQRLVEELRSANEEAQSSNEELQSTNEELQTAKEELQSSNEELTTTNEEMRSRNTELNQVNNDLVNLLSSLRVPIVMLNSQLRIRRYTPVAERVLNLIPTDIGRPISDLKPRINVPDLEELLAKVIESMTPVEREVQDQDGHWYSLRIHPYRTAENRSDGAVLQLVDVGQLKRSNEELMHARDYAEAIIGTVREPLLVLDQEMRVQTANRAFFQTFRLSEGETLNHSIYKLDHGQWNVPTVRGLLEGLMGDRSAELHEIEVEHDFERIGWKVFQLSARRVSSNGGSGLVLLALDDITERKRAAESKYRRLFETAKDGIVIVNADTGEITDANPYVLALLGVSREGLVGKNVWDVKPLLDHCGGSSILDRLRNEDLVRFSDISLDLEKNRRLEVEVVANMYEEGEKRVAQFNIRDITERKHFDQRLQQAARLESLGILAGGIAHDFNNLLSGILGNAGLALSDAPAGSPYQSALKDVVRASQRAADLTRQMLAYSGRGRFVVRPLNLSKLVSETSKLVRSSIPSAVELNLDLTNDLPSVEADSGQIQQLVMNLIINAAESIGENNHGQVRVSTRLEQLDANYLRENCPADKLGAGSYVVLEVSDTGCGMDEATQSKIFDPFFTTKFTGRGLGLASVQGIVRGHGGAIFVRSAMGRGTTFTVLFPFVGTPESEFYEEPKPEELAGSGTVLVVDDEEIALSTMRAILERSGYKVVTAVNGEAAVSIVGAHVGQQKDKIDLVILDLAMPGMGGDGAFTEINRLAPKLPILLTSGYDATEAVRKLGKKRPAGFIQKPATVTDLLQAVKQVLSR